MAFNSSSSSGTSKLNDLNITKEEVDKIAEALKKPEFRKLLAEYAEEISNPENRKKYEEDIAAMEREQGRDVQFIHPTGAWVIKSSDKKSNTKVFVNIASNDIIGKPSSNRATNGTSTGLNWNIPHSLAPPRDDADKSGNRCQVVDVVFHPDTIRMAQSNKKFKEMINSIAIDAVCKNFQFDLEKDKCKSPKNMTYKGQPRAAVVRKPADDSTTKTSVSDEKSPNTEESPNVSLKKQNLVEEKMKSIISEVKQAEKEEKLKKKQQKETENTLSKKKQPKYSVVYSKNADIQDFVLDRAIAASTMNRPSHIRVTIEVPGVESVAELKLDVFERNLRLENDEMLLDLPLSYPVDESNSSAKFDKKRHSLSITMPVLPPTVSEIENAGPKVEEVVSSSDGDESPQQFKSPQMVEEYHLIEEIESSPTTIAQDGLSTIFHNMAESTKQVVFESKSVKTFADVVKAAETIACLQLVICGRLIDFATISSSLLDDNRAFQLEFTSRGQGGFPIFYQLMIRGPNLEEGGFVNHAVFPEKEAAVGGRLRVILMKAKPQIWNCCQAGIDLANLQQLNLEIDDSIPPLAHEGSNENMRIISVTSCSSPDAPYRLPSIGGGCGDPDSDDDAFDINLVESASSPRRGPNSPRVKFDVGSGVNDMCDENICINTTSISRVSPGLDEFVIDFDDGEYEDDDGEIERIRVICDNTSDPGKPSILKSASSIENIGDDSSHFSGRTRRRKSVSFSDKVDNIPFHKADPAAAIYRTLKNRRRRERRRSAGSSPRESNSGTASPGNNALSNASPTAQSKKRPKRRPYSMGALSTSPNDSMISSTSTSSTSLLASSPSSSEDLSLSLSFSSDTADPVENSTPKIVVIPDDDEQLRNGELSPQSLEDDNIILGGSPSENKEQVPVDNNIEKVKEIPISSSPIKPGEEPPLFRPETCLSWETNNNQSQQPESASRRVPFELSNSLMYELDASG